MHGVFWGETWMDPRWPRHRLSPGVAPRFSLKLCPLTAEVQGLGTRLCPPNASAFPPSSPSSPPSPGRRVSLAWAASPSAAPTNLSTSQQKSMAVEPWAQKGGPLIPQQTCGVVGVALIPTTGCGWPGLSRSPVQPLSEGPLVHLRCCGSCFPNPLTANVSCARECSAQGAAL